MPAHPNRVYDVGAEIYLSLQSLLLDLWKDQNTALDADKLALSMDHLCGKKDYKEPRGQARVLPKATLERIMAAAENAFLSLPTPTPEAPKSYLSV